MPTFIPLDNIITQIASAGDPAANFTLEAFIAGTSTPTNLFTTNAGGGGATSFTLNAEGYISASGTSVGLFRDDSINLKLVLKNASDSTVWTFDNVDSPATVISSSLKTTESGTELLPAIILGDGSAQDIDTGWWHSDTDEWSWSANGVEVLSLLTTGLKMFFDIDLNGHNIDNGGVIFLIEQAAADADVAGSGQDWVKTATPNEKMWTDDAGTDFRVGNLPMLSVQTSTLNPAIAFRRYPFNTNGGAFTVTLPSAPVAGETRVGYFDYLNTFATNNLTWTSSDDIENSSGDYIMDINGASGEMLFVDATIGWKDVAGAG